LNALGCEAGPGSQLVTWGKVDGLLRACVRATRGFDAESLEFVDMIQAGIIDPTKVERVALQFRRYSRSALLRRLGHERGQLWHHLRAFARGHFTFTVSRSEIVIMSSKGFLHFSHRNS
jgi:hypothetical protein